MSKPSTIKTIKYESQYKFKEKGSLFHSIAIPLSSEGEFVLELASIKKKYFDATHYCYSYSLLPNLIKYSDDGEPSGSAGIRILNAIEHFGLVNLFIVVIRYFGGTKLGVGPLGKAYYLSAFEVLKQVDIIEKNLYNEIKIEYTFDIINKLHHNFDKFNCKIISNEFNENPSVTIQVRSIYKDDFLKSLQQDLYNQIIIKQTNREIYF